MEIICSLKDACRIHDCDISSYLLVISLIIYISNLFKTCLIQLIFTSNLICENLDYNFSLKSCIVLLSFVFFFLLFSFNHSLNVRFMYLNITSIFIIHSMYNYIPFEGPKSAQVYYGIKFL